MKKRSIITKSVILAINMLGVAHADNNNWTGPYAGVNSGVVFNNAQLASNQLGFTHSNGACNGSVDDSMLNAGVQGGYLFQWGNAFVSGVEANASINDNQNQAVSCHSPFNSGVYDRFTLRNQMQASIKGRLGRVLNSNNSILPYLTAGVSLAKLRLTYKNEGGDYYSNTTTSLGGLIGGGVEWAFRDHWSLRAEYDFVDYGNVIKLRIPVVYGLDDPQGNANMGLYSNNVVIAINYWV